MVLKALLDKISRKIVCKLLENAAFVPVPTNLIVIQGNFLDLNTFTSFAIISNF
jgi:hypothetical protein